MRQQPLPLDYGFAFALYCLMGLTDYFDGYVARARGAVSRLGIFLDPIADKIMIAAALAMLIANSPLAPSYFATVTRYVGGPSILPWRSERRRVGDRLVSKGRSRGAQNH